MSITELLHSLTQKGINILFSDDFEYGLSVSWGDQLEDHTHLNCFKDELSHKNKIKDLEKQLINLLTELDKKYK